MAKRINKPKVSQSRGSTPARTRAPKPASNKPASNKPASARPASKKKRSLESKPSASLRGRDPGTSRINKVLASAGLGSRRQVEELILQGRVEVDGETITDLGTKLDPSTAKVKVDGTQLKLPRLVYYALNKPKGVLSTNWDPSGRLRVIDLVPDRQRVFSVGRLDLHSEGLILLTNDGQLAQRLAHPRFRIQKCYFVVVAGVMTREELNRLRKGVYLAEGVARIDGARIRKVRKTCTELEIILSEGKNREIRRILARAGHKVVLLRRIAIGPLRLGELPVGAARVLTTQEIKALFDCTAPQSRPKRSVGEKVRPNLSTTEMTAEKMTKEKPSTLRSSPQLTGHSETTEKLSDSQLSGLFESTAEDDFGLGLEEETRYDDSVLQSTWEDNQWDDEADDQWDDDFAVDLRNLNKTGRVLVEEEEDSSRSNKGKVGNKRRNTAPKASSRNRTAQSRRTSPSQTGASSAARTHGSSRRPSKSNSFSKGKRASEPSGTRASGTRKKGSAGKPGRGGKRK